MALGSPTFFDPSIIQAQQHYPSLAYSNNRAPVSDPSIIQAGVMPPPEMPRQEAEMAAAGELTAPAPEQGAGDWWRDNIGLEGTLGIINMGMGIGRQIYDAMQEKPEPVRMVGAPRGGGNPFRSKF